ncbi:hypothetical protein MP228_008116 [Amoeboaphelidium protococcarum]|nr:hypothetical protein MP228_008116 [Amoeboaphelidium protococcarum]
MEDFKNIVYIVVEPILTCFVFITTVVGIVCLQQMSQLLLYLGQIDAARHHQNILHTKQIWCDYCVFHWKYFMKTDFVIHVPKVGSSENRSTIPASQNCSASSADLQQETALLDLSQKLSGSNAMIICNHQLYLDWFFLWLLIDFITARTRSMMSSVTVILKKQLANIWLVGYGMTNFNFIFMNRKWSDDKDSLLNGLNHLRSMDSNYWLMLFPEGTTLHPITREQSEKYADRIDMKTEDRFQNVLLPRARGTYTCLRELMGIESGVEVRDPLKYVVDVTFAFDKIKTGDTPEFIYPILKCYLWPSMFPLDNLHVYIDIIDAEDIPCREEVDKFERWLFDRFQKKEELLGQYYRDGRYQDSTFYQKVVIDASYNHDKRQSMAQMMQFYVAAGIFGLSIAIRTIAPWFISKLQRSRY